MPEIALSYRDILLIKDPLYAFEKADYPSPLADEVINDVALETGYSIEEINKKLQAKEIIIYERLG